MRNLREVEIKLNLPHQHRQGMGSRREVEEQDLAAYNRFTPLEEEYCEAVFLEMEI
jgi:hypothetical protein